MNFILLSGGSGKRLWPLSNDIRSKQFLKVFKNQNGEYESMIQRIYRQIKTADETANLVVATSKSQVSAIRNQLGQNVALSIEPSRRDTFPAIALATAYMHYIQGISEEKTVVVCPVDPYVNDDYFSALKKLDIIAKEEQANLILMGIKPSYPNDNYGYIIPKTTDIISAVQSFKEKPDVKTAQSYINNGALWNGGVFAYKLKYVLNKLREHIDFRDYNDLLDKYEQLEKISFDYAIVEKEHNVLVMQFSGEWKDVGTWSSLTEVMTEDSIGEAILSEDCLNVNVLNELSIPILCMGLKDIVVSVSSDGILISDKVRSNYIKPYVEAIDRNAMYAEKSWGSFHVLDVGNNSLTVKATIAPNHRMSYHSHTERDEIWNIISGSGIAVVNGERKEVRVGDVISIPVGTKHAIIAKTELTVLEIQYGNNITINDKIKHDL